MITVNGDKRENGYLNIGPGASAVFANGRSGEFLFYETRTAHEYITQHCPKAGIRLEFRELVTPTPRGLPGRSSSAGCRQRSTRCIGGN